MFKCKRCEALQDEVKHLREMNKSLLGTVTALQSPQAYQLVNEQPYKAEDYYGGGNDQYIAHDIYGQPVIVEAKKD